MKRSEFRALIREEIKQVIRENKRRKLRESADTIEEVGGTGGDYLTAAQGIITAIAAITAVGVPTLMSAYKDDIIDAVKSGKDAVTKLVKDIVNKEK